MSALLLNFPGWPAAADDIPHMKNIAVDIKKPSDRDISITMTNTGAVPVYFYDSLFAGDDRKLPSFWVFRECGNDLERCNENDWIVPQRLFMSSTLIRLPVALSKIDAGESIVKVIGIVNLIEGFDPAYSFVGKPGKKDIEKTHHVQMHISIYFDEDLKIVKTYQSEWLPIQ